MCAFVTGVDGKLAIGITDMIHGLIIHDTRHRTVRNTNIDSNCENWFFVALPLAKISRFCFGNCESKFLLIGNEYIFAFSKLKPLKPTKISSVASSF